ncbi:S1C family serine protease [Denitrobacterium detoxificans]|uniref:S1C family serine protease n=1 Tax=Denitrobacterium detoxificans TaxID=79604 RepID=UPI0026EEF388|nr:trypsin-like peptidase domain-containing protein [Denitrobacterium detoxificans]MBE6465633.1 PDZ domain-containing protein [Denitrobacterium detoxificans]
MSNEQYNQNPGAPVPPASANSQPQSGYAQPVQPQPSQQAPQQPAPAAYQSGFQAGQSSYQQPSAQPASAQPYGAQQAQQTARQPFAAAQPQQGYQRPAAQQSSVQSHVGNQKTGGGRTFGVAFAGAACACAVAALCLFGYNAVTGGSVGSTTVTLGSTSSSTISASDDDATLAEAVAEKVLPSIVAIDVYTDTSGMGSLLGSSSSSSSLTQSSLGSGVIISTDGYILTNYHVIESSDALKVTANGQEYDATVVGYDSTTDLAVIKIDATDLTAIEIGDSSSLKEGQWVMTAGSPFGLEQSVATGIVSATNRTITVSNSDSSYSGTSSSTVYTNMIQTDAAINPGNSGGALVDENGALIGINSVIESYSGNYSGVGFAIPVNDAMNIASQIIEGKTPTHAYLGVAPVSVTSTLNQRYKLGTDSGAYVNSVVSGGAASNAGIQEGDIITKVGDTAVTDSSTLIAAVRSHNPGDTVTVTFLRDGNEQTVEVTLGSDEATSLSSSSSSKNGYGWGQSSSDTSSSGEGSVAA